LSRYFDVETDIAQASAKRIRCFGFRSHAKDNPAIFNLWSLVLCNVFLKVDCSICIFNESCAALQKNKVDQLPVKSKN
jgi:A/G-specific adenine glycosylase